MKRPRLTVKKRLHYIERSGVSYKDSLLQTLTKKTALIMVVGVLLSANIMAVYISKAKAYNAPVVLGQLPYQKLLSHPLSDRVNLLVNAANGNVLLQSRDLNIAGTQLPLSIVRYYNNLGTGNGQAGNRNTLSIGKDVHITGNSNGSATYQGPSGFSVTFPSNGSGGYNSPAEYTAATLSNVSGGGWTLKFNQSGEKYTFNTAGNLTKDESANGKAIVYTYDTSGRLSSATDTQNRTVNFTYSGSNTQVWFFKDNSNRQISYSYMNGNLTTAITPNAIWNYGYDSSSNLTSIQDPKGRTTGFTYDSSRRVTSVKYNSTGGSAASTWTYTYNSGSTVVTDPLTHTTTYNYDTSGRVTDIIDGNGQHHGSSWDANNNMTSQSSPSGNTTSLSYDSLNNLTSVQNPSISGGGNGAKVSFAYNNSSLPYSPTNSTDGQGNQVAYSYNTAGNMQSATNTSSGGGAMGSVSRKMQGDPNGSGGTVSCGAQNGQICSSTDAKGNTTTYGYDAQGNMTSITNPGNVNNQTITYDSLSRPHTLVSANGATTTYTYDDVDRVTHIDYGQTGFSSTMAGYSYDGVGNLTQAMSIDGTQNYTYDDQNRITQQQAPGSNIVNYTYDATGNLKTVQTTGGGTTTYNYDNANQVTSIQQSSTGSTVSLSYTNGRVSSITLPGGITETIGYDENGRQTSIKAVKGSTVLTDYTGSYVDALGRDTNLLQTEMDNKKGLTTTYSYDGLNRLTSANQTGTGANSYTYTYDDNGNITQTSHNGTPGPTFGYNAANELTTVNGSPSGSYDNNGNQTQTRSGLTIGYNSLNQAYKFTPSGGTLKNASYIGDGQADRYKFDDTTYVNSLVGMYSEKTGFNGTPTYYTHLPSSNGQIVSERIGTNEYYYLPDLRGSIVGMTDSSGNIQNTYSYDPYGNTISSTGSIANPWRFHGTYLDTATELYKMGERYYNPADGRWTQQDPTAQNPGYVFANDNPINNVDPSGTISLRGALGAFNKGCGIGVVGYGITTAAISAGSGVGFALVPEEVAGSCLIGGLSSYYDYIGNKGASRSLDQLDYTKSLYDGFRRL